MGCDSWYLSSFIQDKQNNIEVWDTIQWLELQDIVK